LKKLCLTPPDKLGFCGNQRYTTGGSLYGF